MRGRHLLVLGLLCTACLPFTCTQGGVGKMLAPWTYVTPYAYWDTKVRNDGRRDGGVVAWEDREEDEGGSVLTVILYSWPFNPNDDRGDWSAQQWNYFTSHYWQDPQIRFSVAHGEELKDGATLEWETAGAGAPDAGRVDAGTSNEPTITGFGYWLGQPRLDNRSEFPDQEVHHGTRRKVTIKFDTVAREPGPMGVIRGTLTYKVEKADKDPDPSVEGETTVNFTAPLLGERFALCNEYWTAYVLYGMAGYVEALPPCSSLHAANE